MSLITVFRECHSLLKASLVSKLRIYQRVSINSLKSWETHLERTLTMTISWNASTVTWKECLINMNSSSLLLPSSKKWVKTYSLNWRPWSLLETTPEGITTYSASHSQSLTLAISERSPTHTLKCLRISQSLFAWAGLSMNGHDYTKLYSMMSIQVCHKAQKASNSKLRISMKMSYSE